MKWITLKKLQRDYGLSWMIAEPIICEHTRLLRRRSSWRGYLISGLYLGGLLWVVGAIDWLWPSLPRHWALLLRLPGLALVFISWWILPRLLAADAILPAAQAQLETLAAARP